MSDSRSFPPHDDSLRFDLKEPTRNLPALSATRRWDWQGWGLGCGEAVTCQHDVIHFESLVHFKEPSMVILTEIATGASRRADRNADRASLL